MLTTRKQLKRLIHEYFEITFPDDTTEDEKEKLIKDLFNMLSLNEVATGRVLERIAKRITYDVFEYLIDSDIKQAFANKGNLGFEVETNATNDVDWLDRVIVYMRNSEYFASTAAYEYDLDASDEARKSSDIIVNLYLPNDYSMQEISKMRYEIESDIRHELEHSGQSTEDLMNVRSTIQTEADIWTSLDNAWSYYASDEETAAHVSGWVLKAKRTKQDINDLLYRELYKIYATGLDAGYDEQSMHKFMQALSKKYYNYLKMRWNK